MTMRELVVFRMRKSTVAYGVVFGGVRVTCVRLMATGELYLKLYNLGGPICIVVLLSRFEMETCCFDSTNNSIFTL